MIFVSLKGDIINILHNDYKDDYHYYMDIINKVYLTTIEVYELIINFDFLILF